MTVAASSQTDQLFIQLNHKLTHLLYFKLQPIPSNLHTCNGAFPCKLVASPSLSCQKKAGQRLYDLRKLSTNRSLTLQSGILEFWPLAFFSIGNFDEENSVESVILHRWTSQACSTRYKRLFCPRRVRMAFQYGCEVRQRGANISYKPLVRLTFLRLLSTAAAAT